MGETMTYTVPAIHCGHCEAAITREVSAVEGVASVDIDLGAKRVTVHGSQLDDGKLRAAIDEAGFDVTA